MRLEKLIEVVLSQENVFNTVENAKEVVERLVAKEYLRVEEDVVVYLP